MLVLSLHPVCVTLLSPARLVVPHDGGHSLSLPDAGLRELTLLIFQVCGALTAQGKTLCPVGSQGESGVPAPQRWPWAERSPEGLLIPGDESNQLVQSNCFGRIVSVPAPLGAWTW